MSGTEKKGSGNGKGRHVRSARALRYLFASGILKGSGKGKGREVSYDRKRAGQVRAITDKTGGKGSATYRRKSGRAANMRHNHNSNAVKSQPSLAKSGLGTRTAHLQKGAGGLSAKEALTPSRGTRIAKGLAIANSQGTARKALKGSGLTVREARDKGPNMFGQARGPLTASGQGTKLQGDTRFLVRTARKDGKVKPRWAPNASTREARITAGRAKAQAFLQSERGHKVVGAIQTLASANRRTGRRDYGKEARVKAAKADLKAAGVKVKTGTALAKKGQYSLSRRLSGDFSGRTYVQQTPKYAAEQAAVRRKAERATAREQVLAGVRGKSRAERIAAGKAIVASSPHATYARGRHLRQKVKEARAPHQSARQKRAAKAQERQAAQATASASARQRRLSDRSKRVARGEELKAKAAERRLGARRKREARAPALDRKRRIKAGLKVLSDFRARRDSQYSSRLF